MAVAGVRTHLTRGMIVPILSNPVALTALVTYGTYSGGRTVWKSPAVREALVKILRAGEKSLTKEEKSTIKTVIEALPQQALPPDRRPAISTSPIPMGGQTLPRSATTSQVVAGPGVPVGQPYPTPGQNLPATQTGRAVVPQGGVRSIYPPGESIPVGQERLSIANRRIEPAQASKAPVLSREEVEQLRRTFKKTMTEQRRLQKRGRPRSNND